MIAGLEGVDLETLRPLLPVGYHSVAEAYRRATDKLSTADLTDHYTRGLEFFHNELTPSLKRRLTALSGGVWQLDDYVAYAAGSDVDFMSHVVEAVAAREGVAVYPGDWYGFQSGCTHDQGIKFSEDARGKLAAICVPSVRNGHLNEEMVAFLESGDACLLNINLYPTLAPEERTNVARALEPILPKSVLSISFSRGFGLTASQLGVALVHRDHPYRQRFAKTWDWFTYFYNAIAARAFMHVDLEMIAAVDFQRRAEVVNWLSERGLPVVGSGSYYVKSFRVEGTLPEKFAPLTRDGLIRLCMKPSVT